MSTRGVLSKLCCQTVEKQSQLDGTLQVIPTQREICLEERLMLSWVVWFRFDQSVLTSRNVRWKPMVFCLLQRNSTYKHCTLERSDPGANWKGLPLRQFSRPYVANHVAPFSSWSLKHVARTCHFDSMLMAFLPAVGDNACFSAFWGLLLCMLKMPLF